MLFLYFVFVFINKALFLRFHFSHTIFLKQVQSKSKTWIFQWLFWYSLCFPHVNISIFPILCGILHNQLLINFFFDFFSQVFVKQIQLWPLQIVWAILPTYKILQANLTYRQIQIQILLKEQTLSLKQCKMQLLVFPKHLSKWYPEIKLKFRW